MYDFIIIFNSTIIDDPEPPSLFLGHPSSEFDLEITIAKEY